MKKSRGIERMRNGEGITETDEDFLLLRSVAAGAVVSKDLSDNIILASIPAKIIRNIKK